MYPERVFFENSIKATGCEGAFQRDQNADLDGAALGES